jgi:pseudouridine synthase
MVAAACSSTQNKVPSVPLILLNKPYGVLSQFSEGRERPGLASLVAVPGVYPAGRLDADSEGLLLLTDDGGLLHRLTHPRYEHPKVYHVLVEGVPGPEALEALRRGVSLKGRTSQEAEAALLPPEEQPVSAGVAAPGPATWLRIVLREGRKRQVRRMTAAVGHPTLRLIRVALGPLTLGDLAPGQWRELGSDEREALVNTLRGQRQGA